MERVLIPGSFDPITVGHMDIIRRAAHLFPHVVVAVMTNDMQNYVSGVTPKRYMFTQEERCHLACIACAELPNVEVISAVGRLIDVVDAQGIDGIIKGVRTAVDFEYEQKHALWNRAHNPRAETLYMPATPSFDGISSTWVRKRLEAGESVEEYVPASVSAWIAENLHLEGKTKP
jgi:pantetheine-phosphate adenylyltransferase